MTAGERPALLEALMSIVSGIVLICDLIDGEDHEDEPSEIINGINRWLVERSHQPLKDISNHAGGIKHPQMCIYAAGLNAFSYLEDEFMAMVMGCGWGARESVVLIIQPEDGPAKVMQPSQW